LAGALPSTPAACDDPTMIDQSSFDPGPVRLVHVPVQPEQYTADLELLDRYQSYSAELLRVSLLGMSAFGFLLEKSGWLKTTDAGLVPFAIGVATMAISAGAALGHRYLSSDSMGHWLNLQRLNTTLELQRLTPTLGNDEVRKLEKRYCDEDLDMKSDFKLSALLLWISAVALGIGIVAVAATFFVVLRSSGQQ
jgi:hypothetical protein